MLFCLWELENQEQIQHKSNRRNEINKSKEEINEVDAAKAQNIKEVEKISFFKK